MSSEHTGKSDEAARFKAEVTRLVEQGYTMDEVARIFRIRNGRQREAFKQKYTPPAVFSAAPSSSVAPGPAVPPEGQWERYCQEHLQPSVLFKLAVGLSVPDAEQRGHIESCDRCRTAFDRYREVGEIEMRGDREVMS